ncbi:MAG: PorP/SprF family type IX secretion system membrane protein [Saprospiraceae bacterium]
MNKNLLNYRLIVACILFVHLCVVQTVNAQEPGYFNHQFLQPVLINPGATGFHGDHQLMAGYKHKWSDFPDAPRTFTALYHGAFADKVGLGIQLLSDNIGVSQVLHGQLNYAYRFTLNNAVIGVGLSTGIQNFKIKDAQDLPLFDPTDPLANEAIDGYLLFDGSAGIYGEIDEKLIFGISFPNVVKQRIAEISGEVNLKDLRTFPYAVLLGYRYKVENYNFLVEPSILVKDLRYSPFLVDINLKLSFLDEQLVGGLGYTLGDNSRAALLLGTRLDNLRFFYSYDVSLGDFQEHNNGSHELTLVYRIPPKPITVTE